MLYSHYLLFSFFFYEKQLPEAYEFYSAVASKEKRIMQNLILILTPWKYVAESVIIYFHNFVVFIRH